MENYIKYLEFIDKNLSKYFLSQTPYIKCKRGCSKCCENGDYPYSKPEVDYLLNGYSKLTKELQKIISDKITDLKQQKSKSTDTNFSYACPFLINNECSVYTHRGVICRTFGLISVRENCKPKIPFCAFEGLNYSNVLDKEKKIISDKMFQELNEIIEPLAFNTSYKFLTNPEFEKTFGVNFGKPKSLIDWL